LPGPGADHRIGGGQVSAGDLQADERLAMRLVLGGQDPLRFLLVLRTQAGLFSGLGVLEKKASTFSLKESELFHG